MIESTGYTFSLEHAEVGDKLMVSYGGFGRATYTPVTITKVTKTRIETSDGNQWMRGSKRRVGSMDRFSGPSLYQWNENAYLKAKREVERLQLAGVVDDWRFHDLPYDVLLRIHEILKAAEEEKKAQETK